jgi:predicted nucleic-acid-binding Zn-ribbon protein
MTEMQRYERDATCPKCGSTDIAAEYKAASSGAERWLAYGHDLTEPVPDWMWDVPESIRRTCRWCKYTWAEEPLDVPVRELSVKTTDD